jgi:hypothetical protein
MTLTDKIQNISMGDDPAYVHELACQVADQIHDAPKELIDIMRTPFTLEDVYQLTSINPSSEDNNWLKDRS